MTEQLVVSEITEDYNGSCDICGSESADSWLHSESITACVGCVFSRYNVSYDVYLESVLNSRRRSIESAKSGNEPAELIGQCHRNTAVLVNELRRNLSIPDEHIVIYIGQFDDSKKGWIRHYWVGVKAGETEAIHIDPVVPVDNGGIWVNRGLPDDYMIEEQVSMVNTHRIPAEVRKWIE